MAKLFLTLPFALELSKKANPNAPVDHEDVESFVKSIGRSYDCTFVGLEDDCYILEGSKENISRLHMYTIS